MSAPTQTTPNKTALSQVAIDTAEGVAMHSFMGVKIGAGTGTPDGEVTAPKGSLFLDVSVPKLYINTNGATAWKLESGFHHFYAAAAAAASTDGVHAFVTDAGDGTATTVTTGITNPAVPRNISATVDDVTGDDADIKAVSVILTGTNYLDEVITETLTAFTVNTAGTVASVKAFKTVTSILLPAHDSPYDVIVSIGWGDILGLNMLGTPIHCLAAYLADTIEGTAAAVTSSATAIESCTIDLNSALDATDVDAYLVIAE